VIRGRAQTIGEESVRPAVRIIAGILSIGSAVAAILGLKNVLSEYREYRALLPSDPSGAEVYLDGALIWGAGMGVALFVSVIAFWFARRRG